MRNAAGVALTTSAMFLAVVAVMLNSSALFYMSTAIIATILASRLQAWLSVRGLHFERTAPEKARVGELITIDVTVWSDRRIRRPLVTIVDALPSKMVWKDRTPSLPIAPAFDVPIKSQYSLRPLRRGRFRWSGVTVVGTDALGLVSTYKTYDVSPVEILIVPNPLPLDFDLPPAPGWGFAESEHGQGRGAGIEPRGIRDYVSGDSLRFVHWRSSARAGRLLVKEFATGTHSTIAFVFQRTRGTEIGTGATTTLEQMCANAAYMTEKLIRQGAEVSFPTLYEKDDRASSEDRHQQVLATLAEIEANLPETVSEEMATARGLMPSGGLVYLFVSVQDTALPYEIQRCAAANIQIVVMAYDVMEYVPPKHQGKIASATDKDYVRVLEEAGARVIAVGRPEAL